MTRRHCTETTQSGRPCRAWAVHDTDPPLCSAHAGRNVGAGALAGNQNARKHGFYARTFTAAELADLVAAGNLKTLEDEVAIARVVLRRLLEYLQGEDLPPDEIKTIAPLVLRATGRIARLLKDQKLVSGETGDAVMAWLADAVTLAANEIGVDL